MPTLKIMLLATSLLIGLNVTNPIVPFMCWTPPACSKTRTLLLTMHTALLSEKQKNHALESAVKRRDYCATKHLLSKGARLKQNELFRYKLHQLTLPELATNFFINGFFGNQTTTYDQIHRLIDRKQTRTEQSTR